MYKARAFYNIIYDDGGSWDDDSACGGQFVIHDGGGRKVQGGVQSVLQTQQYSLYPNPNNGNINLIQKVIDENPVNIEVLNAEGQSVFKKQLLFRQGSYPIQLQSLSPGLYLMQLRDAAGKSYTLKFIVNLQ